MFEEEPSLKYNSENRIRQKFYFFHDKLSQIILEPPEWLEGLESPFKWGLHIKCTETVTWNIPDKLCDYENQGAFYGFEKFGFLLTFIFMKTLRNQERKVRIVKLNGDSKSDQSEDSSESEEEEEEVDEYDPEKSYTKCIETVDEMASNEGNTMFSRIGPAFQHVLQSTRAHMLYFNGNHAESQEIAKNIQPVEEMSQECKAGFEGIRAKVIMSMYQDYRIVLPYLHKAIELDPEFGYWPYLTGKVLRRARREFQEGGNIEEELKYFEKAVSFERNPKFLVFLAQAYQEVAFFTVGSIGSKYTLLQKAVELYSECWSLKSDSAAISRRVGNGMMKMDSDLINVTVAKEALLKAVELSPNSCTRISLGKFYYRHEKNDEKALEEFQKCHPSDFGTAEIIRLNLIRDPDYDPYDVLQQWLQVEENAVKQYRAFSDAAWYYLVFKRDLESASKYIWRIIVKDDKSIRAKKVLEFQSYGFCVRRPINLIKVMVNEILLLKEKNKILPVEEQNELKRLENFLEKLFVKYPDLCNITPKHNLVTELKEEVDRGIASMRRRRYGYDRNRRPMNITRGSEESGNWRNHGPSENTDENHTLREPYMQQVGDGNRRYNRWYNSFNIETDPRNSNRNRHSFSLGDDESRSRDHSRSDNRSNSESQAIWRNASSSRMSDVSDVAAGQSETSRRLSYNTRGRTERQHNISNNNRYDVTITDWRSENRR